MKINISEPEYRLLIAHPETRNLTQLLSASEDSMVLRGTEKQCDELRDACSDLLQLIGFDKEYVPTKEGVILEALINKLLA